MNSFIDQKNEKEEIYFISSKFAFENIKSKYNIYI